MSEENGAFKILDLDDFVPLEKTVKIKKKEYRVRGDSTVKMTLELMRATEHWSENTANAESIEKLLESVKGFFIDPIDDETLRSLDAANQLPRLITFLFGKKPGGDNGKNE